MGGWSTVVAVAAPLSLCLLVAAPVTASTPTDEGLAYWQSRAGVRELAATDAQVVRIERIVERLLAASPRGTLGRGALRGVHVFALPDDEDLGGARMLGSGHMLLDQRLLALADRVGSDADEADIFLAFVVAHELIHLLDQSKVDGDGARGVPVGGLGWRERLADSRAVELMALAAYDVDRLVYSGRPFFGYWARARGSGLRSSVFLPRADLIAADVRRIRDEMALFRVGLRWFELGALLFAEATVHAYATAFPAAESHHLLGLIWLRLAISVLRDGVLPGEPGNAAARACWPLLAPPSSPRAQSHSNQRPITLSPLAADVPVLLASAVDVLEKADKAYGGSADVQLAIAAARMLQWQLGEAEVSPHSAIGTLRAAIDKVPAKDGRAIKGRLWTAAQSVEVLSGQAVDAIPAAWSNHATPADRRCIACLKQGGCDPPPSAPHPAAVSHWDDTPFAPGMQPTEALDAVGREPEDATFRRHVSARMGWTVEIASLRDVPWLGAARVDVDLAFVNGALALAQWSPRGWRACPTMPSNTTVVEQLSGARTVLDRRRGEGQQCIGPWLVRAFRFDPRVAREFSP